MKALRKCIECDREFLARSGHQEICSNGCIQERARKRTKLWGRTNSLRKKANNKDWAAVNKDKDTALKRASMLRKRYNITLADYEIMLQDQNGVCAICKKPELSANKSLSVDHCHTTNKIRGLLCAHCNLAIGLLGDCPQRARDLAYYLETSVVGGL